MVRLSTHAIRKSNCWDRLDKCLLFFVFIRFKFPFNSIGEKSIDEQMITVQFNKDDLGEEGSVIRERHVQGMAITRTEKVLDNASGNHLDVLCPFTWYCLTRTENFSLE